MLAEVDLQKVTSNKVHNSRWNLNMQITDINANLFRGYSRRFCVIILHDK